MVGSETRAMSEKIVVAMSGGVDSSVAACLLHEQGHEVVGFFMRTGVESESTAAPDDRHRGCCSASDASDARFVAGQLGIGFYALNFQTQFDSLIDYFADEYAQGRTPNPCVMCNQNLKFGRILDYADSIGAHRVATGHYARMGRRGKQAIVQRGVDPAKDQSYVLFGLERESLDRILFPIGHLQKSEVRDHARRFGLPIADKPDSVEICFVPDRDYAAVVRERRPEAFEPGPVVDQDGQTVGTHDGVPQYTVGQRRGLGIAMGLPIYVTGLDADSNTVTVGPKAALQARSLVADRPNWLVPESERPQRVTAKIRYHHVPAPAVITTEGERLMVEFDDPQQAITPGQAVVFYDGEDCLGGAWIDHALAE
jgi:tRNA-specific 2-thiouridylase